jgi:signal transduction histidine kinase
MNIIDNACHAISQKSPLDPGDQNKMLGTLTIKSQISKEYVKIHFLDDGVGIPKEDKDKIFEPYFSTKPDTHGMGKGLSVSFGIIEEHSGKINVDSEPGIGTTVTLILPIEQRKKSATSKR